MIRRFLKDQSGATAIEYAIIAGMIFLVIVGSFTVFAGTATTGFRGVMNAISDKLN